MYFQPGGIRVCNTESVILSAEDVSKHSFLVNFPDTGFVPESKSLQLLIYGEIFNTILFKFFQCVFTIYILR